MVWTGRGTRWRSCLRHCATSRKIAGSIPDDINGIFQLHNPSVRTIAQRLTQPLTEMSTRNLSWGVKAASMCWLFRYSEKLTLLETSWPVQACNGVDLPLPLRTCGAIAPEPQIKTKQFACCDETCICHCTKYLYKPDSRSVGTRLACRPRYLHVLAEYLMVLCPSKHTLWQAKTTQFQNVYDLSSTIRPIPLFNRRHEAVWVFLWRDIAYPQREWSPELLVLQPVA